MASACYGAQDHAKLRKKIEIPHPGRTPRKWQKIRQLHLHGNSVGVISAQLGLTKSTVHSIVVASNSACVDLETTAQSNAPLRPPSK